MVEEQQKLNQALPRNSGLRVPQLDDISIKNVLSLRVSGVRYHYQGRRAEALEAQRCVIISLLLSPNQYSEILSIKSTSLQFFPFRENHLIFQYSQIAEKWMPI